MAGQVINVFGPEGDVTVLDGDTFCVSDASGDFSSERSGFFSGGTRFLSHYTVRLEDARLEPVRGGGDEHFRSMFFLQPHADDPHLRNELTVSRQRTVCGHLFQDVLELRNWGARPLELTLIAAFGADFGAIGKLGEGTVEVPFEDQTFYAAGRQLQFSDPDPDFANLTQVVFSDPVDINGGEVRWSTRVPAGASSSLTVTVSAISDVDDFDAEQFDVASEQTVSSYRQWRQRRPVLETRWSCLESAYDRSIFDLASLRIKHPLCPEPMVAAGLPWFMTVFGRDSLVTCLQTMLLGDDLARNTLTVLAALQSDRNDPSIDAEPGKILHELRRGKAAARWFPIYYGSADSTPLWLILLSEVHRWTGDDELVRALESNARRALEWLTEWGDVDGDGFIEFDKRAKNLTGRGLSVQTWKDSEYSQVFHDGRLAQTPIAAAEIQGYAYDAFRRTAELAAVWGDSALGADLSARADLLQRNFDDAFWLPDQGYYALALDRNKQPVDSLASNLGHLLWSGIVPHERAPLLAKRLLGPELFSGWGIRSLGEREGGYNPLVYHNGCVWPHDCSLAAWGLARYGFHSELTQLAEAMLDAAALFDFQLPELFAGYSRDEVHFPVAYPATCKPQAWAAGVPVLFARILLGLEPDPAAGLVATCTPPDYLDGLHLHGVPARGRHYDVRVEGGRTVIEDTTV